MIQNGHGEWDLCHYNTWNFVHFPKRVCYLEIYLSLFWDSFCHYIDLMVTWIIHLNNQILTSMTILLEWLRLLSIPCSIIQESCTSQLLSFMLFYLFFCISPSLINFTCPRIWHCCSFPLPFQKYQIALFVFQLCVGAIFSPSSMVTIPLFTL